jgi:hypothetical protein
MGSVPFFGQSAEHRAPSAAFRKASLFAAPEPHSRVALINTARAAHFPLCAICPLGNKISTRAKTPGLAGTQRTLKIRPTKARTKFFVGITRARLRR